MVKIAILGYGTVGSGVDEVIFTNRQKIFSTVNDVIEVKYVFCRRKFDNMSCDDKFICDFSIVEKDKEIEIVVEAMGGVDNAYDFTKRCLKAGKSVCTSNKELVALKGDELLEIARENNVNYLFEASVGGGIPILRPILQCLAANEIKEIKGILNGTTNYILTEMIKNSVKFEDALKKAQEKGYAEKNPTEDIKGYDACRKICILSSLAFGDRFEFDEISCEGIENITLDDSKNAEKLGYVVKLVARAILCDDKKVFIYVAPHLVKEDCHLAVTQGVFNAVVITGNATGDVMFYGKGAGKLATASAVVADIIDCIAHKQKRRDIFWGNGSKKLLKSIDTLESKWYVCNKGEDGKITEQKMSTKEAKKRFAHAQTLMRIL